MSDEPEASIFSMRVADLPVPYGPAIKAPCDECGEEIWLSPSSQSILAEAKQLDLTIHAYCNQCMPIVQERHNRENPEDPGAKTYLEGDDFLEAILQHKAKPKHY